MNRLKTKRTTSNFTKILLGLILIILSFGGFYFGKQQQKKTATNMPDNIASDTNQSLNDNISEREIWISPDKNQKLLIRQNTKTFSGDLYYFNKFYDTELDKVSSTTTKVLDFGEHLPFVNIRSPLWSSGKFIITLSVGDTSVTYLCFTDGSSAKELSLEHSFRTEEYIISWLNSEKVLGEQIIYKDTIQKPVDRISLPENVTVKYWVAPINDLSKKTFIKIE